MIAGSISVNDYLQAQRLHRKSIAMRSNLSAAVLVTCGVVAFLAGSRTLGVIAFCAGMGAFIAEYVTANFYLPRKVEKLHAQQKDLANPFTYSWDGTHLEARSSTGSARRPWTRYVKVSEDENIFLLYHSDNMFEMLPKSWFESAESVDAFRNLALRRAAA